MDALSSPEPVECDPAAAAAAAAAQPYNPSGGAIVFTQQPRGEVTKAVYFELRFKVVCGGDSAEETGAFSPAASLRYEDGTPVQSNILEGVFKIHGTECRMRLRILELSKNHRNQRFQVQIEARGAFGWITGCVGLWLLWTSTHPTV
jgi:hypothetical protein